jgi:hypothetical protein
MPIPRQTPRRSASWHYRLRTWCSQRLANAAIQLSVVLLMIYRPDVVQPVLDLLEGDQR